MKNDNKKKVWALIQNQGDLLLNKLSPHPNHPKGRNPYAHICSLIKSHFGCSYKDVDDERIEQMINFIKVLRNNEREDLIL